MLPQSIESIGNEILKPNLDLSIDYSELALDEFLGDGLLKEMPVIKTLVGVVKTGIAIKERFFIKKFLTFLREFHSGSISQDSLDKFKIKFESDQKYREDVTEQVLILVEALTSVKKVKILARLFVSYIDGNFDWDRFRELALILERLSESCYPWLDKIANDKSDDPKVATRFLVRPHIFNQDFATMIEIQGLLSSSGIAYSKGSAFIITKLGQDLYYFGIKKLTPKDGPSKNCSSLRAQ
jgi:hypothetical protein